MSVYDPVLNAADPARSAWVSANAGAGKTHTLANRVTRLLLENAKPERILCLTYTKAAAAEMAARLFDQLGKWAMASDQELSDYIEQIGEGRRSGEDLRKARRLFASALETPGGLKIQTIHSFCQNLLLRFPVEAGVPPGFTVMDEQSSGALIAQARNQVLEHAGSGNIHLAAAVAHLITHESEQKLHDVLDAALGGDRRKLARYLVGCSAHDGTLSQTILQFHGLSKGDSEDKIIRNFLRALKSERDKIFACFEWLRSGGINDNKRANGLETALTLDFNPDSYEALRGCFLTGKNEIHKNLVTKGTAESRPDLNTYFLDLADRYFSTETRRRAARAASLCDAALTIADAVREIYAVQKKLRSALDYDDLIAETLRLLETRDAAAWVLFKLDGGLDHVLVDEAQDTSPEQWAILKKLTEEFFTSAGSDAGRTRTIFAVGDEKQSIFSFQGADPAQFDIHRQHFEAHIKAADGVFNFEMLKTSRRSVPEVLRFVDEVFSDTESRVGLTSMDGMIQHEALRALDGGRVEFWPSVKPDDTAEPDPWRPVDTVSVSSPVTRLAEQLARNIKGWIDQHITLPGRDKPIQPGDIMILLPRREPFGSEIIRQLKLLRVPVAGADRIRITQQIGVKDLIALGRFALLPEDDLNLATILRSPLVGISEEELFSLSYERENSLWNALRNAGHGAVGFLADCMARADFVPPYEFYAHVLSVQGMRLKLLSRLGAEAGDAVEEFLSLALAYESQNPLSLEGFLHWVERGGTEIKRDMERARNEVRVMTVHGSKGLEADIVILPDTTRPPAGGAPALLFHEDRVLLSMKDSEAPEVVKAAKQAYKMRSLHEHRRLLYVALTRAKERLYICGFENRKGVHPDSWYAMAEKAAKSIGTSVERDGETIYVLGDPTDALMGDAAHSEAPEIVLPDWTVRPAPLEEERPRMLRPSLMGQKGQSPLLQREDGIARGILVHAALAHLPEVAEAERRDVLLRYLAARGLSETAANSLAQEILAVLTQPDFAPVFAPGSRGEVALVAELPELGGAKVNGRVDRLAVTAEEVLVVDFKSDRAPPQRDAEMPAAYMTQMALYRAALQKIFPGRAVRCALLWTDGPVLSHLEAARLDGEIARLSRLDGALAP